MCNGKLDAGQGFISKQYLRLKLIQLIYETRIWEILVCGCNVAKLNPPLVIGFFFGMVRVIGLLCM